MRTPIWWFAKAVIVRDGISAEDAYMEIKETQTKKCDGSIISKFAIRIFDHNEDPVGYSGCKTIEEARRIFVLFVSAYQAEVLLGTV